MAAFLLSAGPTSAATRRSITRRPGSIYYSSASLASHFGLGDRPQWHCAADRGHAVNENQSEVQTFVACGHVVQLEVRKNEEASGWVDVTVTLDYGRAWRYNEPGWRPLSFGLAGVRPYWWSARHLVLLPDDVIEDPVVLDVDEDMLIVFVVDEGWLVVCETSVRLIREGQERSRVELPDMVLEARWRGSKLGVLDAGHQLVKIAIAGEELAAEVIA